MGNDGLVEEGDRAPEFQLPADDGRTIRLADLRGRKVVLFFYPKDDTPGCTIEACEFRDAVQRMDPDDTEAVVLGISPDPVDSHRKFRDKYDLNFPLLADTDHSVAEAYGVWKRKSFFGKKYWGVERSTFVIDEEGRIERAMRKVSPRGHARAVLGV